MQRKPNFDVNVKGRIDERTYGIWASISHPAISRCDRNTLKILPKVTCNLAVSLKSPAVHLNKCNTSQNLNKIQHELAQIKEKHGDMVE